MSSDASPPAANITDKKKLIWINFSERIKENWSKTSSSATVLIQFSIKPAMLDLMAD